MTAPASSHPAPPAPPAGAAVMGHPPGLFLLFMVEMWERFSFYGMKAILGLYFKAKIEGTDNPGRGWSEPDANNLVGWYLGLAYLTPIFGGLLADRLIGTHRSMLVGGTLIALGHVVLALSGIGALAHSPLGLSIFVAGLALIVIGTGHFKPSVSVMVNQLYRQGDARRESAFSIFYMGINLGALLGTFACGYLGERVGWHYGFGAAAVGMFAGLLVYLFFKAKYLPGIGLPGAGSGSAALPLAVAGTLLAAGIGVLFHLGFLGSIDAFLSQGWVATALLVGGLVAMAGFASFQRRGDRGPVVSIFILMVFNVFFWLAFEQSGTSINFFTDNEIDRTVGGVEVPTSWFQNINPLTIIILAPIFGLLWSALDRRRIVVPQSAKVGLGLIFVGLGFLFVTNAGMQAGAKGDALLASMWLIVATYIFHTIGEIILSPTGLAYVTKVAPVRHTSLLMGVWFLSSFIAQVLGGKLAGLTKPFEDGEVSLPWNLGGQADFFSIFVVFPIAAGVIAIVLTPLIRRLTAGRE